MKKKLLLFFSLLSTLAIGQSIQSISPTSGNQGQLLTIAITGQNTTFQQGTNIIKLVQSSSGTTISPSSVSFVSNTLINATFAFNTSQSLGLYDMVVDHYLMTSTLTLPGSFTLNANANPPSLSSISPSSGMQGDTIVMTINGTNTNFNAVSNTIWINNGSYSVNPSSVTVVNNTDIQATFIFNNASLVGNYTLHVSNSLDGALLLSNPFYLNAGTHPAAIKSISPNSGTQGQSLTIAISGQNTVFQQGTNVIKLVQGATTISTTSSSYINDSLINASFALSVSYPAGLYDVVVDHYLNTATLTLPSGFTLNSSANPPSLSSISPTTGAQGDTVTITINGLNTNFNTVTNTIWINNGSYSVNPSSVTVVNNTTIQATFIFNNASSVGNYTVHVTNSLDGALVLNNVFYLNAGAHPAAIKSISPDSGAHGQTLSVSISGQNTVFQQGTNSIKLVQGATTITPTSSSFINDSLINASFTLGMSVPSGLYDVVVDHYLNTATLTLPHGFYIICNTFPTVSLTMTKDSVNSLLWYLQPTITGTAPFTYLWNFGDGDTSTLPNPTHTYSVAGHYAISLKVKDASGCGSTAYDSTYRISSGGIIQNLVVINPLVLGTESLQNTNDISIYPNPTSGKITIENKDSGLRIKDLEIYNLMGEKIYQAAILNSHTLIDISSQPNGVYFLQLKTEQGMAVKKIILQR